MTTRSPRPPASARRPLRVPRTDAQRLERDEFIATTTARLRARVREDGRFITGDDRVSSAVAAALIGVTAGTLSNWRVYGDGPRPTYMGRQVSYELRAIAEWLWARRSDPPT